MTKEVAVAISGTQSWNGEGAAPVELCAAGQYFQKNGKHYLLFEETGQGNSGVTRCRISLEEGRLTLTKRGAVAVQMVFEPGTVCRCHYSTPFGSIPLEITTRCVRLSGTKEQIEAEAGYVLCAGCGEPAVCTIRVCVRPRRG